MIVKPGLEILCEGEFAALAGKRVGLFTNPSAVDRSLRSTASLFKEAAAAGKFKLTALFAPEHGLDSSAPDGRKIESSKEGDLPIHSLYGDTQRPTPDMLADLDVIVCDIQDIGVRYYTYTWTVSHILEAAGEHNVAVLILDRPNPLGGTQIEGPALDPALSSLVGRFSVPIRHGLTLGELAQMCNERWTPKPATLTVIACEGWARATQWETSSLTFVPPSPNMPHLETVYQYPGACLIEGTNLSEGRGTALPFEIVGAPYVTGAALADHLNKLDLPGVRFRPHSFVPTTSKWSGERCGGVQVHITDQNQWHALRVWLNVIQAVKKLYPDQFAWLPPGASGVEAGTVYHFDRLIGSSAARECIDQGGSLDDLIGSWEHFSHAFEVDRWSYLLYM